MKSLFLQGPRLVGSTPVPTLPKGCSRPDAPSSGPCGGHGECGPGWKSGLCAVASFKGPQRSPTRPHLPLSRWESQGVGGGNSPRSPCRWLGAPVSWPVVISASPLVFEESVPASPTHPTPAPPNSRDRHLPFAGADFTRLARRQASLWISSVTRGS